MNRRELLIDCNNFYASCERIFRPDLKNKPIVVLSNNDGCIIAMSNEAKKLNIKRSEPYFKIKNILKQNNVAVFSSNYTLYGDISTRVMNTIESIVPDIEIYSIDEAFAKIDNFNINDAITIKNKVLKDVGIPVSIGAGATKTLAKIASRIAKKYKKTGGVFDISSQNNIDEILNLIMVEDIWGVGYRSAKKLNMYNIQTAKDMKNMNINLAKRLMGILGVRTVKELNGEPCIDINTLNVEKKSIVNSRSFGKRVTELNEILEATAYHAQIVAQKLRHQHSCTSTILVSLRSHPYNSDEDIYRASISHNFLTATNSSIEIITEAKKLATKLFKKNLSYKKVTIMAFDLIKDDAIQLNLFDKTDHKKYEKIDSVIDSINKKMGKNSIYIAATGIEKKWSMKRDFLSPNYTTRWSDIPVVKAK